MINRLRLLSLLLALVGAIHATETALRESFVHPPDSARPWVYWTWIDGNINREGITADLEAMKRVGLGGALILDVAQSMPAGPVHFFDAQWQALFKHTIAEARRLGLEINMNDGPGYYGSGGPWVPPDMAMQTVVQSETHLVGGVHWTGRLARPVPNPEYRDIGVVAVAETQKTKYEIPDFTMKALQWQSWIAYRGTESAPLDATAPADAIIPPGEVVDLTERMAPDGSITWEAPAGDWTILRFGHAWNGHVVGPSRPGDAGPETDKLNKAATAMHFNAFVQRLNELVGPDGKGALVATHIDSWEGGGQNWTGPMRAEFRKRRGYDPLRYLPILAGRVLGDRQISERFLWDLRQTVSELMIENYTQEFQRRAHESGLRSTFESYTTIGHDLDNALFVDEPMAEFWTPNGQGADFYPTVKSMSSAAHLNGLAVVAAESFTSGDREKFLWHPAMLKAIGDDAFCGGINRFVFHRYAAQPFAAGVVPGMQMGPWGLHYERTNTWWKFSGPWHDYLARCQYLLRQGACVADVLKLESEEPLRRFQNIALQGYTYDACGPMALHRASVRDGRVVFPSGAQYRLIILPSTPAMTIGLLTVIRDLVKAGAAVLGDPPQKTPGLTDYPRADATLQRLVAEVWGSDQTVTHRPFGKGQVFRRLTPELALAALGVAPDFSNSVGIKFIHRSVGGAEVYFLSHAGAEAVTANCSFRVAGRRPELWDPATGSITPLRAFGDGKRDTTITLPFEPNGSAFIVFAQAARPEARLDKVVWNGVTVLERGVYVPLQPGTESAFDLVSGDLRGGGTYLLTTADGKSRQLTAPWGLAPLAVAGPWQVGFPVGSSAPAEITLDRLSSWSLHPNNGVKYFSGTALYTKTLTLPAVEAGQRLCLNLGQVQVMAKVRLNGRELALLWKPPYSVDITAAARAGENALEIEVVNLWVNRLIGDEQLPEDSERNGNGTLKAWPAWLEAGKPSPTGRLTFSSWRLWKASDDLQDSGLLGPVTLQATTMVPYPESTK